MSYARNILINSGKMKVSRGQSRGQSRSQGRALQFTDKVRCAFCSGTGANPSFNTAVSRCYVCKSKGYVEVVPPVVTCRSCSGTGKEKGDLTCLSCNGVGVVSVSENAGRCTTCNGTGKQGVFFCSDCKGQGIC